MMAESPAVVDEEAQQPAASRAVAQQSNGTFSRRKKAIALGSFLVVAVVLAVALGVALGGDGGDGSRSTSSNNDLDVADLDGPLGAGDVDGDSPGGADGPGIIDSVADLDDQPDVGDVGDGDGDDLDGQPEDVGEVGDGDSTGGADGPGVIESVENVDGSGGQPPPEVPEAVDPPPLDTEVPPVVQAKFLRTSGPLPVGARFH